MISNNPITVNGYTYTEYTMSIAVSPLVQGDFLSAAAVLTLRPIRRENAQIIILDDSDYLYSIVISDVFAVEDIAIITAVQKVQNAIQELINTKGL